MDVIRDYCIQTTFSLVVDKTCKLRYTVRCSDANCEWRMDASRLVDDFTWAIKKKFKIQNTHAKG